MRVVDRVADLEKHFQPRSYVQLSIVAPAVDRLAIDILRDQKGIARGGHAAVQQTSDVVVVKRGQELALNLEFTEEFRPGEISGHDFQSNGLHELAVRATGQINRAHASPAKQFGGSIGAKAGGGN